MTLTSRGFGTRGATLLALSVQDCWEQKSAVSFIPYAYMIPTTYHQICVHDLHRLLHAVQLVLFQIALCLQHVDALSGLPMVVLGLSYASFDIYKLGILHLKLGRYLIDASLQRLEFAALAVRALFKVGELLEDLRFPFFFLLQRYCVNGRLCANEREYPRLLMIRSLRR